MAILRNFDDFSVIFVLVFLRVLGKVHPGFLQGFVLALRQFLEYDQVAGPRDDVVHIEATYYYWKGPNCHGVLRPLTDLPDIVRTDSYSYINIAGLPY